MSAIRHGGCVGGKSPEYLAYMRAKKRCTNPKSDKYAYMLNRRPYSINIKKRPDLTGCVFTWLTAHWSEGTKGHHTIWMCSCVCGKLTHASAGNLKNGHTRSCGCGKRGNKCPIPA